MILCLETTAMNPQFHVAIPRSSNNKCHVVVSVTQHYETMPAAKINKQLHAIGFAVYEVPHSMPRLTKQFVSENVINASRPINTAVAAAVVVDMSPL